MKWENEPEQESIKDAVFLIEPENVLDYLPAPASTKGSGERFEWSDEPAKELS